MRLFSKLIQQQIKRKAVNFEIHGFLFGVIIAVKRGMIYQIWRKFLTDSKLTIDDESRQTFCEFFKKKI
jgi:hypothetical protein